MTNNNMKVKNNKVINDIDTKAIVGREGITKILGERGKVHGDFTENSAITEKLREVVRSSPNWNSMQPFQREAIGMIFHKISRILSGDPNYADHWVDIQGYAKLVEERVTEDTFEY